MAKKGQSAEDLLRALEQKSGGPITWKTYAFYMGKTGGSVQTIGGLLYRVKDSLIFEDFESSRPMIRIFTKRKEYQKTRFIIPVSSVTEVRPVAAGMAKKVINGRRTPEQAVSLTGIERYLFKRVEALITDDDQAYFFELYDREGLARELGL
jgi:hypothetical protein